MSFPYQFDTLQLLLIGVAFIAICVLLQSIKRFRLSDGLFSLVIGAAALTLLYASLMIQTYVGLTSDMPVAHIKASAIANSPDGLPMMSVEISLYDTNGKIASDKTYLVNGNEWMLQGDIVKVSGLLNMAGLHSGYKLTRLEGRYDSARLEANSRHTVIELNGGDDGFFTISRNLNSLLAPFIDGEYGNAVFNSTGSYTIYVSQSGLWAKGV